MKAKLKLIPDNQMTKQESYFFMSGYLSAKLQEEINEDVLIKFQRFLNNL